MIDDKKVVDSAKVGGYLVDGRGPVLSVNKVADDAKMAIHNLGAFQLLEYQSDVQRCRFDNCSACT